MKTPTSFINLVNQRKLTEEIIGICAYGCNKRAKNARDKQALYRNLRQRNRYFIDKYDYETSYREKKESYYELKDKLIGLCEPICAHYDEWTGEYYLFYQIGAYSFHKPISQDALKSKYPNIDLVHIEELHTTGKDITDLISNQFVTKVINLIDSGNFEIVA